ncbi:MAG: DUF2062 domain-containing protein [Deltaproteobacteria bacterium]|nr:DUF2062 domain-containing protein [Deltaproteobacteria bacterium]
MNYDRRLRYYFLRVVRLRGEPHELALGMALGIFTGMMPIMPFQVATAIMLAFFFHGSKITAAIGTLVSNPLNWYFLYYYSHKIGASILGLVIQKPALSSIMDAVDRGEGLWVIIGKMAGAGSNIISSFILGGFIMGVVVSIPSYFIFLKFFNMIKIWREKRKERKLWLRRKD